MIEYIERGALKAHYSWLPKDATLTPKDFDDIIDAQTAADVEPVVREECEHCSTKVHTTDDGQPFSQEWYLTVNGCRFCPQCGRKLNTERSGSGE